MNRRQALIGGLAASALLGKGWLTGAGARTSCTDATKSLRSGERLDIVGNEFHAGGAPVRLLGVAVGDPIYVRAQRTLADYQVIAQAWNANVVRISLHPGHWRADRDNALQLLSREVDAARAAGLRVIIVWQAIGFPGHFFEHPEPEWGLPADIYVSDASLAAQFWDAVAQTFGRDPGILFELWNEPVVDGQVYSSTGKDWPLLKPLWSRLLGTVRRHSDAIVLAAGGCWAHDLQGVTSDPLDDDRVAYAWHCYPPWDDGKPAGWLASLGGVPAEKPVVVTEWGFCRDCPRYIQGTAKSFGEPFVAQVLEPLRLNSTAWCWSPGAAPQMLQSDGSTPTEFGAFVKRYLATAWRPLKASLRTACQGEGGDVN